MNTLLKSIALAALSVAMLAPAHAAPVIPAKYHGVWCQSAKEKTMYWGGRRLDKMSKTDLLDCAAQGSIVWITAAQVTGANGTCKPQIAIKSDEPNVETDDGPDYTITFHCSWDWKRGTGTFKVVYELHIYDGEKYPTSTAKRRVLFISDESK
jgi:hypothetical protein